MSVVINTSIKRLFWGDSLEELDWEKHHTYITQTILNRGDIADAKWLFTYISKGEVLHSLQTYKLDPKSRAFWANYLQ